MPSEVFYNGDKLILYGYPLELFESLMEFDKALRGGLGKSTNIKELANQLDDLDRNERYEIRIDLVD